MSSRTPHRTLAEVGEFSLIERIGRRARRVVGARVRIGIGDDAAVLRPAPGHEIVVSADTWVEDVHFRWRTRSPRSIGRCALAVNLSDIAAMGARPIGFTFALQAPPGLELSKLDGLVDGLMAEAAEHGAPLVGGNLARAGETSIAITVLGEVESGRALLRSGLRAGDGLFVTGRFGAAARALALAEHAGRPLRHRPTPRIKAGRALVASKQCSACIDCSDGFAADLGHLLQASGVGADVDASAVPRAPGLAAAARTLDTDADALCFAGGEDYELIFGLRPRRGQLPSVAALARRLGTAVAEIGSVTATPGIRGLPAASGHTHF